MDIYITQPSDDLISVSQKTGRPPRMIADANGITKGTHLKAGTELIIPSSVSPCKGRPQLLLCDQADAVKLGSAPSIAPSLSIHEAGELDPLSGIRLSIRRNAFSYPCSPTLLMPSRTHPKRPCKPLVPCLQACGSIGLCVLCNSSDLWYLREIKVLSEELHCSELVFALQIEGDLLFERTSACLPLYEIADLIFAAFPDDVDGESWISELTCALPLYARRKTILSFAAKKKTCSACETHYRSKQQNLFTSHRECQLILERLTADRYAGVLLPRQALTPPVCELISETAQIIPASQRNGVHSPLSARRPRRY